MTAKSIAALVLVAGFMASGAFAEPNPAKYENWKTDFSIHSVDLSEVISGGPPRDGIPPIDDPKFAPADTIVSVGDNEPVIVVAIDGDARAYPFSVLMWHEIANDEVGGEPVAVTYCPLCNAAIVFSRQLDGMMLDFGTTGRLRKSDLVMYDRQTESWWQQFSGEAIIGELTGKKLEMLPSVTMPYGKFKKTYPDGEVLVPNDPTIRRYGANPYAFYDSSDRPFLYRGDLPEGIEPMERVVIAESGGTPLIVTLRAVRERERFAHGDVTIDWQAGMASALDNPQIKKGRDVGHVSAKRGDEPIVHHVTFAFVAHAFHPEVEIVGLER